MANWLTGTSTVTIPETLAGRISPPALFSFLNWRIASTKKKAVPSVRKLGSATNTDKQAGKMGINNIF